jgi:hypothetical protein
MTFMIRTLSVALLLVVLVPAAVPALEFQNYYLKRPSAGIYLLEPCPSTRDTELDNLGGGVPWLATLVFQPFFTAPEDVERVVPEGTATATIYLTTGTNGTMNDCAEVTIELARETLSGTFPIAEGTVTTSLFPRNQGGLGNPAVVDVPVAGPLESRTLAVGDTLRLQVSVTNVCEDQAGRQVTLRYDSRSLASRIRFDNVTLPTEGGAADPDADGVPNLCDNCPDISNVAQIDTDRDGVGDACTPCVPGGPTPPECACLGDCSDGDGCSLDACDPQDGCVNDPIPFLEGVRCRLESLTQMIDTATPEDISSRLQRNRSPLKRALRKSFKKLGKAERAVLRNKPNRKLQRKIQKLQRAISKFADKVEAQRLKTRLSGQLRDDLIDEAGQAIDATTDGSPL